MWSLLYVLMLHSGIILQNCFTEWKEWLILDLTVVPHYYNITVLICYTAQKVLTVKTHFLSQKSVYSATFRSLHWGLTHLKWHCISRRVCVLFSLRLFFINFFDMAVYSIKTFFSPWYIFSCLKNSSPFHFLYCACFMIWFWFGFDHDIVLN